MRILYLVLPLLTALIWLADTLPAGANDDWRGLHDEVQSGRLVALSSVLDWLEAHYLGEVLEVEVERDDGRIGYEVEMLGPQGQLVEFEFDATNGELIGIEGVNIDAMQRQ
ncbi:PepSY domain-containing protein [Halomonas sp. PR-M31]|uniref:PepSY domain-containing protein n=1 Tax=Halomonas sp. PR-M31 TaxID=1471202 RepID=UPI000651F44B|nr:PepSY domain-containing protein [Halomonas sp. PR-M31]